MKALYECLFHLKLYYPFLKNFGCACFHLLRDYNTNTFYFHTSKCMLLRYSPLHKYYKCLHSSGKIYIASHVLFDETSVPYSTDSKSLDSHYNQLQFYYIFVFNINFNHLETITACIDSASSTSLNHITTTHSNISSIFSSPLTLPDNTIPSSIIPTSFLVSPPSPSRLHNPNHTSNPTISTHPMITKAKAGIVKCKVFLTAYNNLEPSTVLEALSDPN